MAPGLWSQGHVGARLKGANTRVAALGGAGWEDRRPLPSRFSTSCSGRCWERSFGVTAVWTSRTSSCSSFATSSRFCAARWRGRLFVPRIVPCSRQRFATCHAPRAARAWSLRGRCCAGTGRLCAGSGDSRPASAGGRPSRLKWARSCCGSLARIRARAIGGSAANSPNSASERRHRRSVGCSPARDSRRLRGGQVRGSASSCALTRRASSPATSSPSRACSCAATTCCSSSRTRAGASGWPAAHLTPPARGSHSKRAIST